jgi:hypothetical protein
VLSDIHWSFWNVSPEEKENYSSYGLRKCEAWNLGLLALMDSVLACIDCVDFEGVS